MASFQVRASRSPTRARRLPPSTGAPVSTSARRCRAVHANRPTRDTINKAIAMGFIGVFHFGSSTPRGPIAPTAEARTLSLQQPPREQRHDADGQTPHTGRPVCWALRVGAGLHPLHVEIGRAHV